MTATYCSTGVFIGCGNLDHIVNLPELFPDKIRAKASGGFLRFIIPQIYLLYTAIVTINDGAEVLTLKSGIQNICAECLEKHGKIFGSYRVTTFRDIQTKLEILHLRWTVGALIRFGR